MDPGTAMLISAAIAGGAQLGGQAMSSNKQQQAAKYRSREMKRETFAGLLEDALQREAELEAHRLKSRSRLGKSKAQNMQDVASLVRGAFNI